MRNVEFEFVYLKCVTCIQPICVSLKRRQTFFCVSVFKINSIWLYFIQRDGLVCNLGQNRQYETSHVTFWAWHSHQHQKNKKQKNKKISMTFYHSHQIQFSEVTMNYARFLTFLVTSIFWFYKKTNYLFIYFINGFSNLIYMKIPEPTYPDVSV